MKKLLISMVALLAMSSLAMGASAAFDWAPAQADNSAGDVIVPVQLWATGDTELDAMSLALELQGPLEFVSVNGISAGHYFNLANDGGAAWTDGLQIYGYDVFNGSTTHLAVLSGTPSLMATVMVKVPAGAAKGGYGISTVIASYGDYASGVGLATAAGGVSLTQDTAGLIMVTPEPMTALLLLGALPLLRRRHA